jgi:hypothetical protein
VNRLLGSPEFQAVYADDEPSDHLNVELPTAVDLKPIQTVPCAPDGTRASAKSLSSLERMEAR